MSDDGEPIRDQFGRPMKSLRISVTDRCNFACAYCMPEGGPDTHAAREDLLSYEELTRLADVFVSMGVDNVRITGGEPLVRNEVYRLVEMLNDLGGLDEVTLTTNGYFLPDRFEDLNDAGLDRVNLSLDTFRRERFHEMTGRDVFDDVMEALNLLLETPEVSPVKINVVAMRGFNDDELVDFAQWARDTGQNVRFIEFMPLEGGDRWDEEKVILMPEMKERLEDHFRLEAEDHDPHAPATRFRIDGTEGRVGFIPSVSHPFCRTCDRVRLTADGQVKNCLFSYEEDDLRQALREEAGRKVLKEIIRENYRNKWEGGCIKLKKGEFDPEKLSRTMSRVGG